MRRRTKIPRILKINWINELKVSVVFNTGESRIIDFNEVFEKLGVEEHSPEYKLYNPKEFARAEIQGTTLSWNNIELWITQKNGEKEKVPFDIGPDTLFEFSKPDTSESNKKIGKIIKHNRLKAGMTQRELAARSGTTRNYISRIENNRSDIEMETLRKIIEIGLGKKLEIVIKILIIAWVSLAL